MNRWLAIFLSGFAMAFAMLATGASAQSSKPNILIIWGDDIGYWGYYVYYGDALLNCTPRLRHWI